MKFHKFKFMTSNYAAIAIKNSISLNLILTNKGGSSKNPMRERKGLGLIMMVLKVSRSFYNSILGHW